MTNMLYLCSSIYKIISIFYNVNEDKLLMSHREPVKIYLSVYLCVCLSLCLSGYIDIHTPRHVDRSISAGTVGRESLAGFTN